MEPMNTNARLFRTIVLMVTLAVAGPANGQVPNTNDTSDVYANTGMGTGALASVTPSFIFGGTANTASGYIALANTTLGYANTAVGAYALRFNTTGDYNTASGYGALSSNTTGVNNTAAGGNALVSNTTGQDNTASGQAALEANTTGNSNTASGYSALLSNTTGSNNNAVGYQALYSNTTGQRNNASGGSALYSNTTANDNNAMGYIALYNNATGTLNNSVGNYSMYFNTTGNNNNAVGYAALYHNTTGSNNSAQGFWALSGNTTGSNNIAIGQYAGANQTTGSSNIYIGHPGVAGESDIIRIGNPAAQVAAYVAGISTTTVTGSAVYVTSSGQLGVLASSERYKTDIAPIGTATDKLQQLRPVSFRLKTDPQGTVQYGLIAEEVSSVYPELVIRSESGSVEGIRYEELTPMLLNEVQQQKAELRDLHREITELKEMMAVLRMQREQERVAMR
jgi:hypothetical protein